MEASSIYTKSLMAGSKRTVSSDNRSAGNNSWLQLANPKAIISIPKYSPLLTVFSPLCNMVQEAYQVTFCRIWRFETYWFATHWSKLQVDDLSISKAHRPGKTKTSCLCDKPFTLCILRMLAMGKTLFIAHLVMFTRRLQTCCQPLHSRLLSKALRSTTQNTAPLVQNIRCYLWKAIGIALKLSRCTGTCSSPFLFSISVKCKVISMRFKA